jgi:hypothetical protein
MTVETYTEGVGLEDWACTVAEAGLSGLPPRWLHVQGVIALARELRGAFAPDGELLVAAAALHDIGWAPAAAATDFPAVDGAAYLERLDAPARLVDLCANYSAALIEAELRGRRDEVARYQDEATPVRDALWYCDLAVGLDGQRMTFAERMADFEVRYGEHPLAGAWLRQAGPELRAAARRTEERLQAHGLTASGAVQR